MPNLIGGLYSYDAAANSLAHVFTRQSIRLTHQTDEGGLWFEYSDHDTTLDFVVEKTTRPHSFGPYDKISTALLDFNRPECKAVSLSYGLWRRATFFLLDSMPVWFLVTAQREAFRHFSVLGAWNNSRWDSSAGFHVLVGNLGQGLNLSVAENQTQYPVVALDLRPVSWSYCGNVDPPTEFSLRYDPSASAEMPVVADRPPLFDQLQHVPFFSPADRSAFLYPRHAKARLHFGDAYVIDPYYGYVNKRCAFTMRASVMHGVDSFSEPSLASPPIHFNDCFQTKYKWNQSWGVALAPWLREELFFALFDIGPLLATSQRPTIAACNEIEVRNLEENAPWRLPKQMHVQFGANLWSLSGLPMTPGLAMAYVNLYYPTGYGILPRGLSR